MNAFAAAALDIAEDGLAVLPLGGEKGQTPLVSGWTKWKRRPGQAFIQKLILDFPDANIGAICGISGITVVDIDDAELLSVMIERFGETPLKILTPSGGIHLWYRNSGEGCSNALRAEGLQVDIKGRGGFVVVPPSVRPAGEYAGGVYRFLAGSWNDLPHLPRMPAGALDSNRSSAPTRLRAVKEGHRNNVLFCLLLRHAKACDSVEDLFDVAETINADFAPPLSSREVAKTVGSSWLYEIEGRNWVGKEQRTYILKSEWEALAAHPNGGDALLLLSKLRMAHWGHDQFAASPKAMAEAEVIPAWGIKRYRAALGALIETPLLQKVHRGGQRPGDPSLFSFTSVASSNPEREPMSGISAYETDWLS